MTTRTHVALLRGVNVGGRNKLPMRELSAIFSDVGCTEVRTYIQSGNVVYEASADLARRVPRLVRDAVHDRLGSTVPVVTRTAAELRRVLQRNPFLRRGAPIDRLHVAFLADEPTATRVASLDPKRSPPDEMRVVGSEIYLHLPNGVARTKLTNAYFDGTLRTTSTVRNWKTISKLVELAGGA